MKGSKKAGKFQKRAEKILKKMFNIFKRSRHLFTNMKKEDKKTYNKIKH